MMRHISRLCVGFVFLWTPFTLSAQEVANPSEQSARRESAPAGFSELNVVVSSRTDGPRTITVPTTEIPEERTRLLSPRDADRLMRNEGVALQWISWQDRGPAWVAQTQSGHWLLLAGQSSVGESEDQSSLELEGFITEIGKDYFIFEGTVKILGAPDPDRLCSRTKTWRFDVTQNRSYYRLREFEWCDYLTDYIDLYFDPALR